ncbi:Transposable element Tcb1 transposase [Anthophora quadrimaculata]
MGKGKQIESSVKNLIIKHFEEGKSYRNIGKVLNLSCASVQNIIRKYKTYKTVENRPRTGRPKKLSRRDVSLILKEVEKNPKISAPKLAGSIAAVSGKHVHPKTVQRALRDKGYRSRVPRRKPLISDKNRRLRLDFAKKYKDMDEDFWRRVLFTDESKFNIFGSDGRAKIWRKPGTALQRKNLIPTVKHGGGSVMVWGAIAAAGVGNLAFIDGILDRHLYKSILEKHLQPSVDSLGMGRDWIFQQDNDPKHTARLVKDWLLYYAPRQLGSPPQSPDLNPIEHVWELLTRKIDHTTVNSKESLKEALTKAWSEITISETENLVLSMPRRLRAVIEARGGPTKY